MGAHHCATSHARALADELHCAESLDPLDVVERWWSVSEEIERVHGTVPDEYAMACFFEEVFTRLRKFRRKASTYRCGPECIKGPRCCQNHTHGGIVHHCCCART